MTFDSPRQADSLRDEIREILESYYVDEFANEGVIDQLVGLIEVRAARTWNTGRC